MNQNNSGMVCARCGAEIGAKHQQCPACNGGCDEKPREVETLPCGHPVACATSGDEDLGGDGVTSYCGWCADVERARAEEREQCARVVDQWLLAYPEAIFTPPAPGEHGKTVDGCSAAALRAALPNVAKDIRNRKEE